MEKLETLIDEQTDRNMRETLVISGVPGSEKNWEATKCMLAKFLEELSDWKLHQDLIYNSIVRAHRGKDNLIFVKFCNDSVFTDIKRLNFKKKDIYINQMRSPLVTKRIKKALSLRKLLKDGEGSKWKMFVNDKIELMVNRPGETKYSRYKVF